MYKYTGKIVRKIFIILVQSSFCLLNFMLPTCGPNFLPHFSRNPIKGSAGHLKCVFSPYCTSVRLISFWNLWFESNCDLEYRIFLNFLRSASLQYLGVDGSCPCHGSSFYVKLLFLSSIPCFYDVIIYLYRRVVFRLSWEKFPLPTVIRDKLSVCSKRISFYTIHQLKDYKAVYFVTPCIKAYVFCFIVTANNDYLLKQFPPAGLCMA